MPLASDPVDLGEAQRPHTGSNRGRSRTGSRSLRRSVPVALGESQRPRTVPSRGRSKSGSRSRRRP
eukprot:16239478-Heterocapsa_arctica.AAC.1